MHIKPKFGGSTITQQVIKNISGDDQQTIKRKLSEIVRATRMEYSHTKEEIFEVYLNIVPMSEGISGVGYASEYYFGKKPDELTADEAATLVGITNAPSRYNPYINPKACIEKRNKVLYSMLECGIITEEEYRASIESELSVIKTYRDNNSINSWFVETVCDDISRDLADTKGISQNVARLLIMNGGLSVYTTVNPKIQAILEEYFENKDNFPKDVDAGLNYSMVITDSKNGNLLGIVGGVGKKAGNRLLNYALVPHAPGSSLKPLALYAPLINKGRINWATVFDDVPVAFNKNSSGEYTEYPKNYPQIYDGLTTVSDALRLSKNTVAVRLYNILGKENIFSSLYDDFGFDTLVSNKRLENGKTVTDKDVSPLALGQLTYGVSLRKLTEAYTVFPNEGMLSKGRSYVAVYDEDGELILENTADEKRVYTQECSRIMNRLLMRVTDSGTAKMITLGNTVDTAGKTGTSGNDKDRLFIGYTPYYTAGIWCGYVGKEKSIGRQSISHLEIWDEVMKKIHEERLGNEENTEGFSVSGLEYLPYCKDSGGLYTDRCMYDVRSVRLEYGYFTSDNKPNKICDKHVLCLYDDVTGAVAVKGCPKENLRLIALLDIPERSFPISVNITDAEFVWRSVKDGARLGDSYDIPYFIYTLEEGEYAGISKGKKQYNSSCYLHDD
jgi:penicillin-binding protein 1A